MFRIIDCITVEHDLRLVFIAGIVCVFACVIGLALHARARCSANGAMKMAWTMISGSVLGCGIWATHFIAMLAYQSTLAITYDIAQTAISIVLAVAISICGMAVVQFERREALGGACVAVAIAVMHFTGMSALRGQFYLSWDASYVVASIASGMAFGGMAYVLARHQESFRQVVLPALILTLAICALHFTAMTAVTLTPYATGSAGGSTLDPISMAIAVASIQLLSTALGLVALVIDSEKRLRVHICELESAKQQLQLSHTKLDAAAIAATQSSESKSQFLANRSHEIRTPLNGVTAARAMRGRVLLAEDNVVNQKVTVAVLHSLGFSCDVTSNGREAVDAAFRLPYDAILMDCQMPELDGFGATAEIRKRETGTNHIPIIALTVDGVGNIRRKCIEVGMNAYLCKPLNQDQLAAALERWIAKPHADTTQEEAVTKPADPGILDEAVFAKVRALSKRSQDTSGSSIIEVFMKDAENLIAELRRLHARMDAKGIAACAHGLRGTAGNVGATIVAQISRKIDECAEKDMIDEIYPLLEELEHEYERTKRAMTA